MLLYESIQYKPSIGKKIQGVLALLKSNGNPFTYLESIDEYIRVISFEYSSFDHMHFVRDLLLECWSQFLVLMKNARFSQQCTLYEYMACIMRRAEFCLENCGYKDETSVLSERIKSQLSQYITLLQLSTSYIPRALIANVAKTREFVFTVFTISIFRISSFRSIFFQKLHTNFEQPTSTMDFVQIPFAASPEAFLDKYLNPNLLDEIQNQTHFRKKKENDMNHSYCSYYHYELPISKEKIEAMSQSSFNIDYQKLHKSIPKPTVIRVDQITYHEEHHSPIHTEFNVDDHNFREIIISQDMSDNPFATTNIQDILRNHQYSINPDTPNGTGFIQLPPLKLPDMNVQVNLLVERCINSLEEEATVHLYERDHPSLFAWDFLNLSKEVNNSFLTSMNLQCIDVLCQAKGILAQFISFYFSYVTTFNLTNEPICWSAIPGFFILERIFLNEFQSYYMSRLSGGILRMNLNVDKVLIESVATSLCYTCCVNGEILNLVLSILFDKCNSNVFLDISRSMQMCFNLLQFIKKQYRCISYNSYSQQFYQEAYQSYEINLLLYLQSATKVTSSISKPTPPQPSIHQSPSYSSRLNDSIRMSSIRRSSIISILPSLPPSQEMPSQEGPPPSLHLLDRQVSQSPFAMPMSSLDFVEEVEEEEEKSCSPPKHDSILPLVSQSSPLSSPKQSPSVPLSSPLSSPKQSILSPPVSLSSPKQSSPVSLSSPKQSPSVPLSSPKQSIPSPISIPSPLSSLPTSPHHAIPNLPTSPSSPSFNSLASSRSISHFNSSSSLVFTEGSSIDLLYSSSINQSLLVQHQEHLPVIQELATSTLSDHSKQAENPDTQETKETQPDKPTQPVGTKEVSSRQLFHSGKVQGFTILQCVNFLIDNNILFSRGEGFDFFNLLVSHHLIEPVLYDRRFRTTIYHVIPQSQLIIYNYPEISPFSHSLFEDHVNYVYIIYILKSLLKSSHLQILEKALVFIYYHQDFFNGKHRLMLFQEVLFPHFNYLFTHWSNHIRHIFHRIIIYKLCRTRSSYLPGYLSCDILNSLYLRVSKHNSKPFFSFLHISSKNSTNPIPKIEASIWDHEQDVQDIIHSSYSNEKYKQVHSKVEETRRSEKIMKTLDLMNVRESQAIDMKLASILQAKLHILLNLDDDLNTNLLHNKHCIPSNQIQYYWTSFLEYVRLLNEYEKEDYRTTPQKIGVDNIYNDGIDVVPNTNVLWREVSEMETEVVDNGRDMTYFVTN